MTRPTVPLVLGTLTGVVIAGHLLALLLGIPPAQVFPVLIAALVWVILASFLLSAALHRAGPRSKR